MYISSMASAISVTDFSQRMPNDSTALAWPRAAVLDCDGLLVDTTGCWNEAYRAAAESVGRSLEGVDLTALDGASVGDAARMLGEMLAASIPEARLRSALLDALSTVVTRTMPGVERLLAMLEGRLRLAVASNAPREAILAALRRSSLRRLLPVIVSAEEIGAFKPKPDVYLEACRRLGVDPSDAIAFEDSTVGACAAQAAGLTVMVVSSEPSARAIGDLATSRIDDPRVLEMFGLAGARRASVA
jgi:HAD superfamily hydrolase (TIGR01509 family)